MAKELSQLDRATRFAIRVRASLDDDAVILKGEDLIDAKALGSVFEWLLERDAKRTAHAREVGKKGGRPKKLKKLGKRSIKKTSAKRRS